MSVGEVGIRFQVEQEDVSVVVLSLPVVKSLTARLAQAVAIYEERTGQKVLLPEEIQRLLNEEPPGAEGMMGTKPLN